MHKSDMMNFYRIFFVTLLLVALITSVSVVGSCRSLTSGDDDDDDDDGDDDDDDYDPSDTTIYDIQQGHVPEGTVVTCRGVVVTTPLAEDQPAIFVQEPEGGEYSGIYLYLYDEVVAELAVEVGDVVDVTGEYAEYYGFSELTIKSLSDITLTGDRQNVEPEVVNPADVATGGSKAENYESVLVKVEDVTVTDDSVGYGEFVVTGGLHVDDLFFPEGEDPQASNGMHFDSITGPMYYSFEEFKLTPRYEADLEGGSGDDDDDDDDDTTIYDIQQGNVIEHTIVTLEGVVATTPLTSGGQGFFVEEPAGGQYSGIYVFVFSPGDKALDISPGDEVSLTGEYVEYNDMSEIQVDGSADVTVTGTASVPTIEVVDADDIGTGGSLAENYEGVLVKVEDVTVTNEDLGHGEWEVDNVLLMDDLFYAASPGMGTVYDSITGCLYYSWDEFKMEPRSAADLVEQ